MRFDAEMINSERDMTKQGARLSKFFAAIHNPEGDHTEIISKAACALSMFSCKELETVFRTDSNVLRVVCQELSIRTRNKMLVHVDDDYKSFASEALAYALPMIQRRREGLGISKFLRPTPIYDILLTLPKARSWDPTKGALCLSIADVKMGHPRAREIFHSMHENNVLVKVKGGGKTKEKVSYTFDTVLLAELFRSFLRV